MSTFRMSLIQHMVVIILFCAVFVETKTHANFSKNQKDLEVLLGDNVTFNWEYNEYPRGAVKTVSFGIQLANKNEIAILLKHREGKRQSNPAIPVEKRRRTTTTLDHGAIFQIADVGFNDSGTYYCKISLGAQEKQPTEFVRLSVVDVLINTNNSDTEVESWDGHKIHLKCAVRLANTANVSFSWNRLINQSLDSEPIGGRTRSTRNQSVLTIVTTKKEDFDPYVYLCTAKAQVTPQTHVITVKQLFKAGPPLNVTVITDSENMSTADCKVYHKITWVPPRSTGGSLVTSYHVEVRPIAEEWRMERKVATTEMRMCKVNTATHLRSLELRIRAKNKVGVGPTPSGVVTLDFWSTPSAPRRLSQTPRGPQSANLTWNVPMTDGGKEITMYLVEYKLPEVGWDKAVAEKTRERMFMFEGRKNYDARVRAENEFGVGPPSEVIRITFSAEDNTEQVADSGVKHAPSHNLLFVLVLSLATKIILQLYSGT